ncbi:2-aminoethylphosphonate--pyruvate transaminase [Acuticoccus sediminis]|uniref:2-aminoethylphosphonate--pyruvate transaminase n=1 Tax=Acuticoccus sediminis TaxID=2184697 RepID=A0A8B2NKS0_9HYPH|nr:2-aminoethylphosphonate--pyruvate transaminase [Acuticoccus sediminis]RAI00096.1 2-aminoethylphosphonate--pyruvate transaminase [Acuticoccus sediminis]
MEETKKTYLLTPGPLTVPAEIKAEMLRDHSPNAATHMAMTSAIRAYCLEICNGTDTHACVPIQGSATYGVEAGLHTLVPRETSRILVVENGFYGQRLAEIATGARFSVSVLSLPMLPLPTEADIEAALEADPAITHIMICHAETGTGVLNPVAMVADVARRHGKELMIDAVASFGGFPIDAAALDALAIFISPNKCLESVPGVALVVARRDALEASAGRSPAVVLDLHAQWRFMEEKGAWRWTPPTHVVAALAKGCERHRAEGLEARAARYRANWRRLVDGLRQRGFETLLPDEIAAPIIATFKDPADPAYDFRSFYAAMEKRGFIIFPGRLTAAGTFRIGVMGDLDESDMTLVLAAIDESLAEIGVATEPA